MSKSAYDLKAVELESRNTVHIRISKIAAFLELKPQGPTRVLFVGGGHIDICGAAGIWRLVIQIAELGGDTEGLAQ